MYPQPGMVSQVLRVALLFILVVLAVCACGRGQEQSEKPRPLPEDEKVVLEAVWGKTVTIDFCTPPGKKFDEFTSESQNLVDSVKWRSS